ncbi:TPA: DUF551 domain-containing protein [Enterobacter hormaechei subsp. xiangfangensis]|nr:DUF551 domain-containing protein [Enterobacter hormaechei subsp. xiangfangensis]HAV1889365.1 DUF551 domain-containing protein [Enterobacter hormaechei subsp. xiangfangensis]
MITLTKEWLLKTIAELEEGRDATPGAVNEDAARALAAMKLALASLEAEPVGFIARHKETGKFGSYLHPKADWFKNDDYEVLSAYTAPPAPVAPDEMTPQQASRSYGGEVRGYRDGWNACRSAMLHGADGTLTNEGTIPVTQFKPVADLYGLTSPAGSETWFTFDAVEARDFIDGGWSCREYVELGRFQEAMLQNGNSPAQSDCCPEQNYIAPAQDGDYPVIPDGWIPVSERMPGSQEWVIVFAKWDNQQVLCWDDVANRWTDFEDQSYYADMFTHWMPLPAAPQQEDIIC